MDAAQRKEATAFVPSQTLGSFLSLSLLLQGLGLVFVAVYQRALKLLYVDELLERVKLEFAEQYKPDQVTNARQVLLRLRFILTPTALLLTLMHCSSNTRASKTRSGKC